MPFARQARSHIRRLIGPPPTARRFSLKASVAVLAAVVLGIPANSGAQTLLYNGSADGYGGAPSQLNANVLGLTITYDNFVVSGDGWIVTGLFGEWASSAIWARAEFQIRTGITQGNGGTLLFAGEDLNPVWSPTGRTLFGLDEYRVTVSVNQLYLAPGSYWLGIALADKLTGGSSFLVTTSGASGVNAITDGAYFFDAPALGSNFRSDAFYSGQGFDFAYGVEGSLAPAGDVVPEPSTLLLVLSGLAGIAARSKRRKKLP
jgi:hypothetical protein